MFNILKTLVRATAGVAEEKLVDRNALLILDQNIRDAAAAVERGKRALALAIAQDEAEARRLRALESRLADLEERAVAALRGGRDDLAGEAAEAIARIESDRDATSEARSIFTGEIRRLREAVDAAMQRLTGLERGRRAAKVAEAARQVGAGRARICGDQALAEAEATLARLRDKQMEESDAAAALAEIEGRAAPSIADRLEAEGFGRRTRPSASAVLDRLRRKAAPEATA